MTLVRARVEIHGTKKQVTATALVGTGATLTLIDREVADEIGVKYTGRKIKLVVADGHELPSELAIVDKVVIEGEELPQAHIAVTEFPQKLRQRLETLQLCTWCIIGATTLETLELTPNPKTGKLEKTQALLL